MNKYYFDNIQTEYAEAMTPENPILTGNYQGDCLASEEAITFHSGTADIQSRRWRAKWSLFC
jgi:hypothetical protein